MARQRRTRQFPRTARVNEVVRETLADALGRLSDPRLGFVTLTDVEVTPDLREAVVYYSVLDRGGDSVHTPEALAAAAPHLRAVLGREVRLKYLPRLEFRVDPAIEHGRRIDEVIRELHTESET